MYDSARALNTEKAAYFNILGETCERGKVKVFFSCVCVCECARVETAASL